MFSPVLALKEEALFQEPAPAIVHEEPVKGVSFPFARLRREGEAGQRRPGIGRALGKKKAAHRTPSFIGNRHHVGKGFTDRGVTRQFPPGR